MERIQYFIEQEQELLCAAALTSQPDLKHYPFHDCPSHHGHYQNHETDKLSYNLYPLGGGV